MEAALANGNEPDFRTHFNGEVSPFLDFSEVATFFEDKLNLKLERLSLKSIAEAEELKSRMYSVVHAESFQGLYHKLVNQVSSLLRFRVLCQRRPTVRIQRPEDSSIIFHIDEWAGHDKESLNVWFPLVNIHESASLGVVHPATTKALLESFYSGLISADELEQRSRDEAVFRSMNLGQVLLFGNHILHGTQVNRSENVRISLDFRLTQKLISKNLHQRYIEPWELMSNDLHIAQCREAVYCIRSSNILEDMSFPEQRALIRSYCDRNSINLIAETHEIQCRPVPSLPLLTTLLKKHKGCDIVMVSRGCFFEEELNTLRDLESALRQAGNDFVFILQ